MIAKAVQPKIEISLSDPAMTMLHRAGVAGLYMTLKALAKRYPTQKSRQYSFNKLRLVIFAHHTLKENR